MLREDYSPALLVAMSFACAIIALLGTLGNLLAVVALLRSAKLRRSSTFYLVNLALSNIPVCCIAMPLMAVCLGQAFIYDHVFVSHVLIRWVAVLGFICNQAELHTICALGFNRLLAMFRPRLYQKLVQINCYRYILAGLWVYSIVLWLPLALEWIGGLDVSEKDLFVVISNRSHMVRRVYLIVAFALPLLFSLLCHVFILCKGLNLGGNSDSASQQQWRHHVTKTVSLVFLVLLLLSVPHLVVHALHQRGHLIPKAWLIVHVIFFGRYILDPVIFVLSSKEYWQAYAEVLAWVFPCCGIFAPPLTAGALAPPCTPASTARHKIIDLSNLDLTRLQLRPKESQKFMR